MSIIQKALSRLYQQDLPLYREEIFSTQKMVLQGLLYQYDGSPLYQNLEIKQEDIRRLNEHEIKQFLACYDIVNYKDHILPLVTVGKGITTEFPDLHIKTSGTSDAHQGGKLIPAQRDSLYTERQSIQRTLSYYLYENTHSKLLLPYSFALTAPFDEELQQGYISGALRQSNKFVGLMMYPTMNVLRISDNAQKRKAILEELLDKLPTLRSIHGVPAWPLGIMDELIALDFAKAKKIFSSLEFVSIGGGSPQDYKYQYQQRLRLLGCEQQLYGSNNHNASEGFFAAQIRNFGDLDFQGMAPLYHSNFFVFAPELEYRAWKATEQSSQDLLLHSKLLHEVEPGCVYFLLVANQRIPWLYDMKDKVVFSPHQEGEPLEYEVIGRYSMSSNIMNEHIESDILQQVISDLKKEGYELDRDAFVAGMELHPTATSAKFHLLIEGKNIDSQEVDLLTHRFDELLAQYNAQWKLFREHNMRITECRLYVRRPGFIRSAMMALGLGHEQSKIPFLSDGNYKAIVEPLLHL